MNLVFVGFRIELHNEIIIIKNLFYDINSRIARIYFCTCKHNKFSSFKPVFLSLVYYDLPGIRLVYRFYIIQSIQKLMWIDLKTKKIPIKCFHCILLLLQTKMRIFVQLCINNIGVISCLAVIEERKVEFNGIWCVSSRNDHTQVHDHNNVTYYEWILPCLD